MLVQFDLENLPVILRWVLEFPFLQWMPSSGGLPHLVINTDGKENPSEQRWRICGILGRGGFGVVLLGEFNSQVAAIKVPLPHMRLGRDLTVLGNQLALHLQDDDAGDGALAAEVHVEAELLARASGDDAFEKVLRKFRREARMLKRLRHPNVVALLATGNIRVETPVVPVLLMQYVSGRTAHAVISNFDTDTLHDELGRILKIGRDVALALSSIHDQGAVHRDLSWKNVMLRDDDSPVVIDLGNVSDPDGLRESLTQEILAGDLANLFVPYTPGFGAPEQVEFYLADAPADQFSLGVILYLWCNGNTSWPYAPRVLPPWPSNDPSNPAQPMRLTNLLANLLRRRQWTPPVREVFKGLDIVLQRMLQKRDNERYPSMRDVAAAFESLLIELGDVTPPAFDSREVTMDPRFQELCGQVKVKPNVSAGRLILQIPVCQCRNELDKLIRNVWSTLFDVIHESTDLKTSVTRAAKAGEFVITMIVQYRQVVGVILRLFSDSPHTAQYNPRFGGYLQGLIGKTLDAIAQLGAQSKVLHKLKESSDELDESLKVQKEVIESRAAEELRKLWEQVGTAQGTLARLDFELALYSLRLPKTMDQAKP